MAKTAVATGDALTRKLWDRKLFLDIQKESYFTKFESTSGDTMVHVKTDLEKEKGDAITFGIRMRLAKPFIVDGQSEGHEHALTTHSFSVALHKYRVPVRDDGELTRKRAIWDVEKESRAAIVEDAAEKLDELKFTTLGAALTRNFYCSSLVASLHTSASPVVAKAGLTAAGITSCNITPRLISFAKTWALTGGRNAAGVRTQTPLQPIKVNGKPHLVLLIHPDQRYDLANDATMVQAHREARERGLENPLFTGADFIWDNVVIHSHPNVEIGTNAGAGAIPYGKALLLGKQALCMAWGRRAKVVRKTFDYDNEVGFDWSAVFGVAKPVFGSIDYGVMGVWTSRTQVTDA